VLDLRQLAALRAVAEQQSIARAARSLRWSQPTIAYHLKGLEIELGAPVVTSSASGTQLTAAGTHMLPHARALLDRAARAVTEVTGVIQTGRKSISLGIFPSAGARLLPSTVRSLRASGCDLRVREAELSVLLHELESMALDAAIIYSDPQRPTVLPARVRTHPLFTEQFFLIVPVDHRLAGHNNVELDAFSDEHWILGASEDDPCDAALLAAAARLGFSPTMAIRSDDYSVISAYVEAGIGIAFVPELALPARIDSVSVLTLHDKTLVREIALVTSEYVDETSVRLLLEATLAARPPSADIRQQSRR
jgi:DNA-binding transcriptional LysR family regulator